MNIRGVKTYCLLLVLLLLTGQPAIARKVAQTVKWLHPDLLHQLYAGRNGWPMWYGAVSSAELRAAFLGVLDSAAYLGLEPGRYHEAELRKSVLAGDSASVMKSDEAFTDALLAFCLDLYKGYDLNKYVSNNELAKVNDIADRKRVLVAAAGIGDPAALRETIASLEPADKDYAALKVAMKEQKALGDAQKTAELVASLNLYRWIHHFHFPRMILVNVPSASMRYYVQDTVKLQMKAVVGKPATKSPRFSTWCWQVVLYPYWNVPRSIGIRELLPRFRRSPEAMERLHMQVVDANGRVVDHHSIDWSKMKRSEFPYIFRQCTGCDNSLGVIKFNLTDPFDVYLHDTNMKLDFLKDTRFLSHGCIRLEKPIALANDLLDNQLDSNFLKACYKNQLPVPTTLKNKVPVFVLYMPAEAREDSVHYYKDIYRIFR